MKKKYTRHAPVRKVICAVCRKPFKAIRANAEMCSPRCRQQASRVIRRHSKLDN